MKSTIPELLAPAGSFDSLRAAVENGADAVYFGSGRFNARGYAPNFEAEDLLKAIDFAHQRDVAAYVTVNTLIKHHELEDVAGYLELLCSHGADAVIIQDTGILKLLTGQLPGIPVHASTQMTIHNSAGANLMENLGVRRAVLARELTLEEICAIRKNTGIQLEVFIHGAMCIAYSGRCLMSSFLGGRSGNRGYCAQPCRKKYRLPGQNGGFTYLLSPKDLNLSSCIHELVKAGVDSLKIEGRMKRPEYVAVVTGTYRDILDRLADDPDQPVKPEEQRRLEIIFNRGFTEGYLHGHPGSSLMSMRMPGNRGIYLGTVSGYDKLSRSATVLIKAPLQVGDGIAADEGGTAITSLQMAGMPVKTAPPGSTVSFPFKNSLLPGSIVFKTYDSVLVQSARDSCRSVHRRIPLDIEVEAIKGSPLFIRMHDRHGNTAEAVSDIEISGSETHPLTHKSLQKQISKLGDTVFSISSLSIRMDEDIFIPVGSINSVRRECIEKLMQLRTRWHRRICGKIKPGSPGPASREHRPLLSVRVHSPEALEAAVSGGAHRVYLDLAGTIQRRSKTDLAIKAAHKAGSQVFIRLPDIMKDSEMDRVFSDMDELPGFDGILAAGPDQLFKLKNRYATTLAADYSVNAFNHEALCFIESLGANSITISPELTLDEVAAVSAGHNIECLVQGAVQLMVSEQCIPGCVNDCGTIPGKKNRAGCPRPQNDYSIMDEKGFEFPIRCDNNCRTHIFNSRELCMIDRIPDIINAGVSSLRIEGILYDNEQIKEVTMWYRQAIEAYVENRAGFDANAVLSRIKALFPQGLTTGHYFRGVL